MVTITWHNRHYNERKRERMGGVKKRMTTFQKDQEALLKKDAIILEFKRLIEMSGVLPKREKSVFQSKVGKE